MLTARGKNLTGGGGCCKGRTEVRQTEVRRATSTVHPPFSSRYPTSLHTCAVTKQTTNPIASGMSVASTVHLVLPVSR